MNNLKQKAVTVLGLGSMGRTIAKLYLKKGYKVTVWNRTKTKTSELVAEGAVAADAIVDAFEGSELILICVFDYAATYEILEQVGIVDVIKNKTIVQLTTGSPKEAKEMHKWFTDREADYLDGAIQVAPEQMALPDTTILLSGEGQVFKKFQSNLQVLGGNLNYLGAAIELANTMDLATLSYVYGSALGFFQGALMAESAALDLRVYGTIIRDMTPNFGLFFQHEANMIAEDNFEITQSPLSISVAAVKRIEESMREANLDTRIPTFINGFFEEAGRRGWGNKEAAIVIELLRSR